MRRLLDFRDNLILGIIAFAVVVLAIKAHSSGLFFLETPHIEGGTETTFQNMVNDHGYSLFSDSGCLDRKELEEQEKMLRFEKEMGDSRREHEETMRDFEREQRDIQREIQWQEREDRRLRELVALSKERYPIPDID